MEYFRLSIRMSTMLNPDFPFEYIPCQPYLKEVIVDKEELNQYKDVVEIQPATVLDFLSYQKATYW